MLTTMAPTFILLLDQKCSTRGDDRKAVFFNVRKPTFDTGVAALEESIPIVDNERNPEAMYKWWMKHRELAVSVVALGVIRGSFDSGFVVGVKRAVWRVEGNDAAEHFHVVEGGCQDGQ